MNVSPWDHVSHTFMTLTFILNIKIIVSPLHFFHEFLSGQGCLCSITMRHVVYIHDLCMTLTFDLYFNDWGHPYWILLSLSETRIWVKKKIFKEIPQFRPFNQIKVPALGVGRSWNLRFSPYPTDATYQFGKYWHSCSSEEDVNGRRTTTNPNL